MLFEAKFDMFSLLPSDMWLENKISYRNIKNGPMFTHLSVVATNLTPLYLD